PKCKTRVRKNYMARHCGTLYANVPRAKNGSSCMSKQAIVLYLHVHQPWRVRKYSVFDTGEAHDYFYDADYTSDRNNENILNKVAEKSYRPMNSLLEELLRRHPEFKVSLSITGTFLEQAEKWAPDVIDSFRRLVATGRVEIVS